MPGRYSRHLERRLNVVPPERSSLGAKRTCRATCATGDLSRVRLQRLDEEPAAAACGKSSRLQPMRPMQACASITRRSCGPGAVRWLRCRGPGELAKICRKRRLLRDSPDILGCADSAATGCGYDLDSSHEHDEHQPDHDHHCCLATDNHRPSAAGRHHRSVRSSIGDGRRGRCSR